MISETCRLNANVTNTSAGSNIRTHVCFAVVLGDDLMQKRCRSTGDFEVDGG